MSSYFTPMDQTLLDSGYLELFIGPMFSGKTSKLLEIYKQCKFCNIPVAVINHSADTRYHDTMLSTHDGNMIPCIQTHDLLSMWDCKENKDLNDAKVILINEGQFFPNLAQIVKSMLDVNRKVYVAGLDGDFERRRFGEILDLVPLCDKVTKFTSLCGKCKNGSPGIFSQRISKEIEQMLIGSDNYIPVCRTCYKK